MTRHDLAAIARAAEIIEREARSIVSFYLIPPHYVMAKKADMLATAKALRAMEAAMREAECTSTPSSPTDAS